MLTRGDILVQFLSFPPEELQCRWADPGTLRELAGIPSQFAIKVFHDSLIFVIIFFLHFILICLLHTYLKVPCSKILKLFLIYHLLISKSMEFNIPFQKLFTGCPVFHCSLIWAVCQLLLFIL